MSWQIIALILGILAILTASRALDTWERIHNLRAEVARDQLAASTGQARLFQETMLRASDKPPPAE